MTLVHPDFAPSTHSRVAVISWGALSLFVVAAIGCASSGPTAPELEAPPRGAALEKALIGTWLGEADDGTPSSVRVEITLDADGKYTLAAGLVYETYRWVVRDDLLMLLPDPTAQASDGTCFRASGMSADRVEGTWAYTLEGAVEGAEIGCEARWFAAALERRP